jgi:hypothetical protein
VQFRTLTERDLEMGKSMRAVFFFGPNNTTERHRFVMDLLGIVVASFP